MANTHKRTLRETPRAIPEDSFTADDIKGTYRMSVARVKSRIAARHLTPIQLPFGLTLYKDKDAILVCYGPIDEPDLVFILTQLAVYKSYGVSMVIKKPGYSGYLKVIDVYGAVLDWLGNNSHIFSDEALTIGGIHVWKSLFRAGYFIYVYTFDTPFKKVKRIESEQDIAKYCGLSEKHSTQRFVLSKTPLAGVR